MPPEPVTEVEEERKRDIVADFLYVRPDLLAHPTLPRQGARSLSCGD
jgi:hypothetical protein